MKNEKLKKLILCAVFVDLIAAGAFMRIPIPVVPFTLQYLFTMLAGLLLGGRLGGTAVSVYVILGLLGLPIFTQGGGPGYLAQPTFGYLVGFAAGAYLTGKIANQVERPGYKRLLLANFAGLTVVYAMGMLYYYFVSNYYLNVPIEVWPLFLYCFILAVPGDILLCFAGAFLGKRLIPILKPERMS